MAMKLHMNPFDADQIKSELKTALNREEVDLGIPGGGRITIKSYLKRTLDSSFDRVMEKLGVDPNTEEPEKTKPTIDPAREEGGSRTEDNDEADVGLPSTDDESSDKGDSGVREEVLKGYLYDGDKPKGVQEVFDLVHEFARNIAKEMGRTQETKKWLAAEFEKIKAISKGDRFDYLEASILNSEAYVEAIANAAGLDRGSVKSKMANFLKEKGLINTER
jgi:hypothetical protein